MSNVMFSYTETNPGTVTKRRQVARYKYMQAVKEQHETGHGEYKPSELTSLADKWWPGTVPTKFENGAS